MYLATLVRALSPWGLSQRARGRGACEGNAAMPVIHSFISQHHYRAIAGGELYGQSHLVTWSLEWRIKQPVT